MSEQTNNEKTNTVEHAEKVPQGLEADRAALVEADAANADKRRAVAFQAHTGNKGARQELDKLAAAAARFEGERRSIEDAIAVAQGRVQAARQVEAQEAAKANALAIREVLAEFTECALSLDEALIAIGEEGAALQAAVRKLRALGCTFPTDQQIAVLGLAAVQTALMSTPWARAFLHLAPKDRRRWSTLSGEWAARINSTYVQPLLGETKEVEEHAAA